MAGEKGIEGDLPRGEGTPPTSGSRIATIASRGEERVGEEERLGELAAHARRGGAGVGLAGGRGGRRLVRGEQIDDAEIVGGGGCLGVHGAERGEREMGRARRERARPRGNTT